MSVNFLPESYLRRRRVRQTRRLCVLAAVGVAVVCFGWGLVQLNAAVQAAAKARALETEVQAARAMQTQLGELTREHDRLTRLAEIGRQLAVPLEYAELIALVGDHLPDVVALTEFEVVTFRPDPVLPDARQGTPTHRPASGKAAPAKPANRLDIQFTAVAPDDLVVAEVVNDLTDHPIFEKVTLHATRPIERFGYHVRQFDLSLQASLDRRFVRLDGPADAQAAVEVTP
jgi:hypothetical protein